MRPDQQAAQDQLDREFNDRPMTIDEYKKRLEAIRAQPAPAPASTAVQPTGDDAPVRRRDLMQSIKALGAPIKKAVLELLKSRDEKIKELEELMYPIRSEIRLIQRDLGALLMTLPEVSRKDVVYAASQMAKITSLDARFGQFELRMREFATEVKLFSRTAANDSFPNLNEAEGVSTRLRSVESRLDDCDQVITQAFEGHDIRPTLSAQAESSRLRALEDRLDELSRRPQMRYTGVWKEGAQCNEGEFCTESGSVWYCLRPTSGRPGQCDDFQLAVKRGRDAR